MRYANRRSTILGFSQKCTNPSANGRLLTRLSNWRNSLENTIRHVLGRFKVVYSMNNETAHVNRKFSFNAEDIRRSQISKDVEKVSSARRVSTKYCPFTLIQNNCNQVFNMYS
jgi:hypothetical protein